MQVLPTPGKKKKFVMTINKLPNYVGGRILAMGIEGK
jgi:hypothetical protein